MNTSPSGDSPQKIQPEDSINSQPDNQSGDSTTAANPHKHWPHLRRSHRDDDPDTDAPAPTTQINLPVLITSLILVLAVTGWAFIAPENAGQLLGAGVAHVSKTFGAFYIALATTILGFIFWLALSRFGHIKLGPQTSTPDYSLLTWAAMLFAAGIGTDILFFSVAEPVTQYLLPPTGTPETLETARQAVVWGLFHYGITGWGMYLLVGVALGYFSYRRGLPLSVRSALYPIFGKRINGTIGHAVDTAALLGTIFGVAASLGIGVVQLSLGLSLITPLPNGTATQIGLVVLAILMASISATTGLDRGIRILSQLNVLLGIGLALWVLITGRTSFLVGAFVTNIGDYISRFPGLTLDTMAYGDHQEWLGWWTLFFWAWWMAWASFVGMFLARISRGRTIREFVVGSLIIPFIYVAMWINIFGDDAIDLIRGGHRELADAVLEAPEQGIYHLLDLHPAAGFTIGLAVLVGLLFYVTSADSGALVMANLSSTLATPEDDGDKSLRILWATLTGIVTISMLLVGGIPALQNATVIMSVPFSLVLILIMVGLGKALVSEDRDQRLYNISNTEITAETISDPLPWPERLSSLISAVSPTQARGALQRKVIPALTDISEELRQHGVPVTLTDDLDTVRPLGNHHEAEGNHVTLTVGEGPHAFTYRVAVQLKPSPAYAGHMVRKRDVSAHHNVTVTGEANTYDIYGLTADQIRHDLVDHYERHLNFLTLREEIEQTKGNPS